VKEFSEKLLRWYTINKRELPWRETKDPYKIWLSEIILQQTQVAQGLSYYQKFVSNYPSVKDLAKAPIDRVMKDWQGLGYYSRARNLHETAKVIAGKYKGIFPDTYKEIKDLKGIGDYTAAAISSIAFDLPHAVVDGNVYRVLSRVFNINTPIDSTEGKKQFQELANTLLPKNNPANFNQAIMEFGARWCRPVNPDCSNCILISKCGAFAKKKVNELPVKAKKTKVRDRHFNYVIIKHKDSVYIRKREENDIWQGLYEFYLVESLKKQTPEKFLKTAELRKLVNKFSVREISAEYKHVLSHQNLYSVFYHLELKDELKGKGLKKVKLKELNRYAFPRLIEKHLRERELIK
jgi:A/G-specific adenine glycosylase